ncbi:MAG: polysaccharide biosynthesis C-terminal domain-containing protein, partial [Halobacteriaceae archaeon]
SLVYGYIGGSVAMMVFGWWKVSIWPSRPTLQHIRSLVDYGRYSAISTVGAYFYSWIDVAILTLFVAVGIVGTRADIGAYENAWRVSTVVMLFSQAIAQTIFPQFSRWNAEDSASQIESVVPKIIRASLLIVIPAFVGTLVLSKDILRVLFGPEFVSAWLALIILTADKIFQSVLVISGKVLMAMNRPDLDAYATIAAIAINLILNIVLIWQFGIVGAAVATTVSFATNTLIQVYYLNHFLTISFPTKEVVWSIVASTIMGISVFYIQSIVAISSLFQLVSIILSGVVIYIIIISIDASIRKSIHRTFKFVLQ